jgi:endoglucanase
LRIASSPPGYAECPVETGASSLKIEIEPHNYGYGFGALIGSTQTPNSSFADLWGKLAFHYKSNPEVIFGLMNEPHDQSAAAWLSSANAAIAAIRSAGATQQILVPDSYWDMHGRGPPRTMHR